MEGGKKTLSMLIGQFTIFFDRGVLFNDIRREGDLMCILGANIYASTSHHANPSVKSNNLVLILVGLLCPRLTAMFDVRPGCLSGDV